MKGLIIMKITSSDIGIIGGADGPTAVFVTTSEDFWIYAGIAAVIVLAIVATIIIIKRMKK